VVWCGVALRGKREKRGADLLMSEVDTLVVDRADHEMSDDHDDRENGMNASVVMSASTRQLLQSLVRVQGHGGRGGAEMVGKKSKKPGK
jgi:hypothetical protein